MLPELARRAISAYSDLGDLVVDPMCGIGTTLVEAIHLGRNAFGIELEPRWASLATANLAHAANKALPATPASYCARAAGTRRHRRARSRGSGRAAST